MPVAELTNLANGLNAHGDRLGAKICRDAIKEIKQLRKRANQSFVDPAFAQALVEWSGEETLKIQRKEIKRLQTENGALLESLRRWEEAEEAQEEPG